MGVEYVRRTRSDNSYIAISTINFIGLPPQSGIPTKQRSNKKCVVKEGGANIFNDTTLFRGALDHFFDNISELAARVNPYVNHVL